MDADQLPCVQMAQDHSLGKGSFDRLARLEDSVNPNRCNYLGCQLRWNIFRQPQHPDHRDADVFTLLSEPLQYSAVVMKHADDICVAHNGLLHFDLVLIQLCADSTADKVRPVRVKAFAHEQVGLAQFHRTHVDGDLLAVRVPLFHEYEFLAPSRWMVLHVLGIMLHGEM